MKCYLVIMHLILYIQQQGGLELLSVGGWVLGYRIDMF